MEIIPLPAFRDNYIWTLRHHRSAVVVDPGDADPVLHYLEDQGLDLTAILVTHHHADHVGGIGTLRRRWPVPVFGPAREAIPACSHPLAEGDRVRLAIPSLELEVLEVPGHTLGHIAYLGAGFVFCGDTLFSAGCGRLFEGTAAQLQASLARLAALPPETLVYCTHEYTLANLRFARQVEPDNPGREDYRRDCEGRRAIGAPTLPSTIGRERAVNPFLRTTEPAIIAAVTTWQGRPPEDDAACFAALREWKNQA
ncbi:MAG: hydroxyacylglutathione hydrolase [Zoogloeaceae bacterium]|nr:hydroxyacylglutathione hydrolase [Zoogloeaceae bacterium]